MRETLFKASAIFLLTITLVVVLGVLLNFSPLAFPAG